MHSSYFKRPDEYYKREHWTYPDTLRVRGSVIPSVIADVVVVTTFTSILVFIEKSHIIDHSLNVPNIIVPALSVVVGLILAFRTNTAYDRFWEGRKLWSNLDVQIRNFSRMIWVGMKETVHNQGASSSITRSKSGRLHQSFGKSDYAKRRHSASYRSEQNGSSRTEDVSSATLIDLGDSAQHEDEHEKVLVIRLLLAYAVAVKHHLRQEFGVADHHDLRQLLPEGYQPCAALEGENELTNNVNNRIISDSRRQERQKHMEEDWNIHVGNDDGRMSLPLEIAHGLCLWVITENRAGRIDPSLVSSLLSSINSMTDIFTNMERIVFTPIPLAYSIHLRQVVYAYCLALPFTFLEALGWLTIPLLCLVSFTLFGMEAIGREIENPFGKDENDLHMDEFCRDLKRELDYTVNLKNTVPGGHQ
ncbi:hypothetical protein BGZ79_008474 [Entomortierella chlamydospora]|nr:hypothetical protein BGZ79_008474 [Entomortierella chlamydospora]